jgi:hypothetical protein
VGLMVELFEVAASLPTFLSIVVTFGFAGFVLRLLVLVYPKTAP